MKYDPQRHRIQIFRIVEVRDQAGRFLPTYPELLWEEHPGRELVMEWPDRWNFAFREAEKLSFKSGGSVSLALIDTYDERALPEHIYSESCGLPAVTTVRKDAVWVPVKVVAR